MWEVEILEFIGSQFNSSVSIVLTCNHIPKYDLLNKTLTFEQDFKWNIEFLSYIHLVKYPFSSL